MGESTIPPLGVLSPEAAKKPGTFGGLFGGSKSPDEGPAPAAFQSVLDEVNNASRRVRVLEDRVQNLRNKLQLIEQNMLDNQKKYSRDFQSFQDDLMRIKRSISDLENKTNVIVKELQLNAKKEDVDVIKKYLDLWEPIQFMTRGQVERLVNDAIEVAMDRMKEGKF